MAKIEIERKADHLKVAVCNDKDVLIGYGFVSHAGGGYTIPRIESWAGPKNRVSIRGAIFRKLSVSRFQREMKAA